MQNIEWKPIKGYEDLYMVSNTGLVKSLKREKKNNNGIQILKEKIMKFNTYGSEYLRVPLYDKEHKKHCLSVHRLVASAFLDNPNNFTDVNHIDGNKHNNNVHNLEWCDRSYNLKHAYKLGLKKSYRQLQEEIKLLKEENERLKAQAEYKIEKGE